MVKSLSTPKYDQDMMEKLENYISLSKEYFKNAEVMKEKQEYSKAGEMFWGAVAELLKAIGMIHGKPMKNHEELIKLAKYISIIKNDVKLRGEVVNYAQALHASF